VIADRAIGGVKADILAPHDMLAPGDTIRVRVANQFLPDMPIADETPTIDEAGYVEIPRLGRVKASGLTSAQLTASILPQQAQRNRESQAPRADLVWSIEKVRPEPTTAPTHARSATSAPATQDVAAGDRKQLQQSASTQNGGGHQSNHFAERVVNTSSGCTCRGREARRCRDRTGRQRIFGSTKSIGQQQRHHWSC
jgi:hypothetical protein